MSRVPPLFPSQRRDGLVFVSSVQRSAEPTVAAELAALVSVQGTPESVRALLQALPDPAFIKDADGHFLILNQAMADLLGVSEPAAAIGRTKAEFYPPEFAADIIVEDHRVITTGEAVINRLDGLIDHDGVERWVLTTKAPIRDESGSVVGIVGTVKDVTALHMSADAAVREAEERFRTFFEESPGPTFIYSANQTSTGHDVLYRSHQFEVLTGYPNSTWHNNRSFIDTVVHPDDRARLNGYASQVDATGEPYQAEYRIITQDDRTLWVQERANLVFGDDGERRYWIGILTDISQQKAAELAREEALVRMEASNRQLEYQNEAKSAFVSVISHEFRTPLTSIQGFSEIIVNEVETLDEARAFATTINQSAERLARLVNDVLDLNRIIAGHVAMAVTAIDINALIESTLVAFGAIPTHQLEIRPAAVLPLCMGDPDRLVQVVTNLVANAVKYAPAGGSVVIATHVHPDGVELTVADQGLGVPEEHRTSIFDPYGRIVRPEQHMIPGTGLGLPICQQIVTLHGGRIWVEPNEPQGSVFHVVLPVTNDCSAAPSPQGGNDGALGIAGP